MMTPLWMSWALSTASSSVNELNEMWKVCGSCCPQVLILVLRHDGMRGAPGMGAGTETERRLKIVINAEEFHHNVIAIS